MRALCYLNDGLGEPPPEWTDYQACQLFHCTPSQLADEDADAVMMHMHMADIYAKYLKAQTDKGPRRA